MLSQITKSFDPAGWLALFIIRAKIIMQALWLRDLKWNHPLPCDLLGFSSLREIRLPRWVYFQPQAKIQYQGFCDASERAYGATVYLRVEYGGQIYVNLLSAETRVAPINSCKSCVVYRKRLQTQMMGDLPAERTTFSFTFVGVDFAGAFDVKNHTSLQTGYVCVSACFSTKDIHLDAEPRKNS